MIMAIRCAHCKKAHDTVADVRACADHHNGTARPAPAAASRSWSRGMPLPFPPARYAILRPGSDDPEDIIFLKVDAPDEGRWAGYVFVKIQASDELHNVRGQAQSERLINAIIEQGWKKCLLRYGQKIGSCGHCGRTLTNEESRAYGIGPVCRRSSELAAFA